MFSLIQRSCRKKNTSQQVFVPWQVKAGNAERSMMGYWVLMGFEGFLLRFAEKGKMFRKRSNWGLNTSSCLCCSEGTSENSDWKLPLEWFLSYQHKTVTVYKCVRVHSGIHMCFFLYITTVNVFLAQLNLSKQHTPTWAVKRADQDMRERTEKKSHTLSDFVQNKEKKRSLCLLKGARKECLGRHESYSLVKSTLSFSC